MGHLPACIFLPQGRQIDASILDQYATTMSFENFEWFWAIYDNVDLGQFKPSDGTTQP